MDCDRRAFLATFGSAALALAAGSSAACAAPGKEDKEEKAPAAGRKIARVGLQLYTVRDAMQRDLPGTLARVAQIGYRDVEFAGYFGRTPAEIRALLEQNGLRSPSSHVGYPGSDAAWAKIVDDAKAAGHEYVTCPWIPDEARGSADKFKRVADLFNRSAQKAKDAGLRFAYHNHDFEFKPVEGGKLPFDLLLESTDKSLVDFEMDLYWTVKAGQDPIAYLDRYPGRFTLVHIKDATAAPERTMVDVGSGTIDFRRIFAHDAEHGAHIKYFFVEHDQPADPMASIAKSYEHLSKMEY